MIRINLLPYRETEKKADLQRQIVILAGTFAVFLLVIVSLQVYVTAAVISLGTKVKDREDRLAVLQKKIGDIEVFKQDMKDAEKKLSIIKTLERNRLYPVRLLDELSRVVPVEDIWLEKLSEQGTELRIEGVARNNIAVALFMKNLEKSGFIKSVDLTSSKQTEISSVKVQQFILLCSVERGA
ncbi:MAG: PilN domain-containing protein [Deltaproteobacteria bacterium]|nr:PilN domain-containing protein [Deltaproteobacteria bacterium]